MLRSEIDQQCLAFENAWKTGEPPAIERFLEEVPEAERAALLRELLLIDVACRRQRGEKPAAADYQARFPGMSGAIAATFEQPTVDLVVDPASVKTKAEDLASVPMLTSTDEERSARFGDYDLLGQIARGGMGVVYKARQRSLRRTVALKMILSGQLASEREVQRFQAEARAAAQLDHSGIVPIYEVGEQGGQHYFTMGYVEGQSLADRLAAGPMEPRPAADLVKAVAEAVHYAHQHGVIHRDLKPANILLDREGRPRVTDFGLAVQANDETHLTATGQVLGTPSYMPPEQAWAQFDRIGPASDVYSLGAVLYHLLTGRPPFQAANPMETLMQVRSKEPVPLRQLNPGVPRDLETITLKCLDKQPVRRYASAQELADELGRYLYGTPIQARPVGRIERLVRWCGRNRLLAAAAGVAALTLFAAVVVSITFAVYKSWAVEQLHEEREQTQSALEDARRQHALAAKTLVDLQTTSGLTSDERGEPSEATLWFANAARLAANDPDRERDNRARVRTWLRRCYVPLRAMEHPSPMLRSLAVHPGGRYLATAGTAGDCVVWDVEQEKALALPGIPAEPSAAAWDPDGKRLALGTRDGQVLILPFPGRGCLQRFTHHGTIAALAFSRDGRYLALAGEGARVWDSRTGKFATVELAHPQPVAAIAFNSTGTRLATACRDGTARVFRIPDGDRPGKPLFDPVPHTVSDEADASNPRPVPPEFVNGDRELLTLVREADGGVVWRDAASGAPIHTARDSEVRTFAVSPDGRYLAVGSREDTQLWSVAARSPVGSPLDDDHEVLWAAFATEGGVLATAGTDNVVRRWSVPDGRPLGAPLPHQTFVQQVDFVPGSGLVVTAQVGGLVRVWLPPSDRLLEWQIPLEAGGSSRIGLSPDGHHVILRSVSCRTGRLRSTRVYEVATGRPAGPALTPPGPILDAAIAPEGDRAALLASPDVGRPGWVLFFDWRTGRQAGQPLATPSEPRSLAYRPDGRELAVLCAEGQLLLIDPAGPRVTEMLAYGPCPYGRQPDEHVTNGSVKFSPDGRGLVAWGLDNAVHAWDDATGSPRYAPLQHEDRCHDAQFSRDGRLLATASYDHTARVWDFETGQPLAAPLVHPDRLFTAVFSPDGDCLLTARRSGSWRVYDWRQGTLLCPAFPLSSENYAALFTPDGHWVVTADGATMRAWEWHTGKWVTPPATLGGLGLSLVVTPDSKHAIVAGLGGTVDAFPLTDLARRQDLSTEDLCLLTELVAAQRIHENSGAVRLSASEWLQRWHRFCQKHPGLLSLSQRQQP